ncbi:hypothetical protein BH10PAT1_BH10PAT1_7950 [soil metagenome]
MKSGKQIHAKAGHLREEGDFIESLKLIIEAIQAYSEEKDYVGLIDAEGDASLSLRHLYKKTNDISYLILAEGFANAAVETCKGKNIKSDISRAFFNLAKVIEEMGGYPQAVKKYKQAVAFFERYNSTLHNRSGVLADMKIHLATAQYRAGNKLALGDALIAMSDLENSDEKDISKYNYDVWLSGANMKLAEILKTDDIELAKKHLDQARKIIDANPELKIRKEQWEELSKSF